MNIGLHLKTFNEKLGYLNRNLVTLNDTDLEKELEKIFRITRNSEFLHLHENNIIAITGLQGVGKSTLIKSIYKIPDNIIPTNLGVGEKIPILITETNVESEIHQTYKTFIKNKEIIRDQIIDPKETLLSLAKSPHPSILYLELKVRPEIFGNENTQFLLLPGFESKKDTFYDLIDNFLYSSTTCIFVTNKTNQADGKNVEKLQEVFEEFKMNKPLLIITSSDNYKDSDNEKFKSDTLDRFQIEESDRVICTGTYREEKENQKWIEEFKKSISKYAKTKREFKKSQLKKLNELLRENFIKCFKKIKIKIEERENKNEFDEYKNNKILQVYDNASEKIIDSYLENISKALEENSKDAKDKITKKIMDEGLLDRIKAFFQSTLAEREEIIKMVRDAWVTSNPNDSFTFAFNKTMNNDVQLKLGRKLPESSKNISITREVMLLGEQQSEIQIEEDLIENLKTLAKRDSGELQKINDKLEASIKLAPSLIVEYIRLNAIYPDFIPLELKPKEIKKENIGHSFHEQQKYNKMLLGGIGAILGIDALDGEFNSIQGLFEATGSVNTVGKNMIDPLSAIFITGSLIVATLKYLNKIQEDKESISKDLVDSIKENYIAEFKSLIEKPIAIFREFLKEKLRQRDNLDKELGDVEKLHYSFAQAARELKALREEVRDSLSDL
ncbi:MAG: hypothetical protein KA146_06365 [Leptospiraceae bacterium]|nr:hypothetical protein [Leptospiraceae bacterium]